MKEFIDKLIERLEEEHERCINRYGIVGGNSPAMEVKQCIDIVNELAEEYNKRYEPTIDLIEYGVDGYNMHLKEQYKKGYEDAKKENGWIPCSERFPEIGLDVLCVKESGDIVIAQWGGEESSYLDEKAVWFLRRGWCRKNHIIAWMPLPAPFKEGE